MGSNIESKTGYVATSQIKEYQGEYGPIIDLGLGTSPIGPAKELEEPLRQRNPFYELSKYPPDPLHIHTRELLLAGIGIKGLTYESVIFNGNGSYGAGDEVVRFLAKKGCRQILTPVYSFPNVAQWAQRNCVKYTPIHSSNNLDPLSSIYQILKLSKELENTIVYLDYPNNPFGIADPDLMRKFVIHVVQNGGVPLIDLAFGEVLGEEFKDAIQYVVDNGGIALGSLSKTQGLPGLRTGYAILSKKFTTDGYNGGERLVFGIDGEAEFVYNQLFSPNNQSNCLAKIHAQRVTEYNQQTNLIFYQMLNDLGLEILPTDLKTQIQVIHADNLPNFYQRLKRVGIITESLADYQITLGGQIGYKNSAVRMLTPGPGQLDEVIKRIQIALNFYLPF